VGLLEREIGHRRSLGFVQGNRGFHGLAEIPAERKGGLQNHTVRSDVDDGHAVPYTHTLVELVIAHVHLTKGV